MLVIFFKFRVIPIFVILLITLLFLKRVAFYFLLPAFNLHINFINLLEYAHRQQLSRRRPLLRLKPQAPPYHLLQLLIQPLLYLYLLALHLPALLKQRLALKRHPAMHHLIQQNPHTSNIHLLALPLVFENLGGEVVLSAAQRLPHAASAEVVGEAEVAQLHVEPLVQQDVLRLDVAVDDVALVDVLQHLQQLPDYFHDQVLLHDPALHVSVESAPLDELQDKIELLLMFELPEELYDVGVVELLLDFKLVVEVELFFWGELLQVDDFEGVFLASGLVDADLDDGVLAAAELPVVEDLEVVDGVEHYLKFGL